MESTTVIKVIGVGGAGCKIVDKLCRVRPGWVETLVTDTDCQAVRQFSGHRKVEICGQKSWAPFHSVSLEWIEERALEDADELRAAIGAAHLVVLTAGMGGRTGGGAAHVLARLSKENGAFTVGIVSLPLLFEGRRRKSDAQRGRYFLERDSDLTLSIDYQRFRKLLPPRATMIDFFCAADRFLAETISSFVEIFRRTWSSFPDMKRFFEGQRRIAHAFGEGTSLVGAAEAAVNCPLVPENAFSRATRVVAGFFPSEETSTSEIQATMQHLRSRLPGTAQVLSVPAGIAARAKVILFVAESL